MKKKVAILVNLFLIAALFLSACTTAKPTQAPAGVEPTQAPVAAAKPLIVAFVHSSTNSFVMQSNKGIVDAGHELGYDVKVFEDNFNQAEQDTLVQQFLASGEKAAGFVWDPADDMGGIASVKRLSETGAPIVALNRVPVAEAKPFITAFAGAYSVQNGREAGRMAVQARKEALESGMKLGSEQGNLLIIGFPLSNTGGKLREDGFLEYTKDAPFNLLASEPAAGYSPDDGYNLTSQLIAKYKDQGIDVVFGENDQLALGAIRALQEAGKTPGKDVFVIGGTCHGDMTPLEDGSLYATNIEPAYLSGYLAAQVLNKIIKGAKVKEGETQLAPDPDKMPPLPDELTYYTYEAILGVRFGKENIEAARLWGFPMKDLCNY